MFLEPEETAFDLRFRVFSTPVRVNIWFWVFSAVLGWGAYSAGGVGYLGLWVGCVFLSILLHELGHVWMGQAFGASGHIILYSFGGLAVGSTQLPERWQRICVLLAGPGAQLVLFLIVHAIGIFGLPGISPTWIAPAAAVVTYLWVINLFWPLFNLMPIWPLDGGQICREVLLGAAPRKGLVVSLWISMVTAGTMALHSVAAENGLRLIPFLPRMGYYGAFLFAMLCMGSWQALQFENSRGRAWDDDRLPWDR